MGTDKKYQTYLVTDIKLFINFNETIQGNVINL